MILLKPITTEKAIKLIELENKIIFAVDRRATKDEIKKEMEENFKVKVESINTHIKTNQKFAYIKLKAGSSALDVAGKLGLM